MELSRCTTLSVEWESYLIHDPYWPKMNHAETLLLTMRSTVRVVLPIISAAWVTVRSWAFGSCARLYAWWEKRGYFKRPL